MTTLLITGGSGYLGSHLASAAAAYDVHVTYHTRLQAVKAGVPHKLDLADREAVLNLIAALSPDAIIHTAASNPGQSKAMMMKINRDGSRYIAEGATEVGARLVHLSSDALHSGQDSPYHDDAPPTPINIYGQSKAAAEAAVAAANPGAAIVRTSLIYGLEEMDRGTAGFVERLQAGQTLYLFQDQIRQPVWINTLITALLKLTFKYPDYGGLLNIVGRQALSREAFGRRMLKWWQVESHSRVKSARAGELSTPIPLDVRLTTAKGERLLNMTFPGVDEVLGNL